MSNGVFFISWQLWQEMTFVLAMGIVIVFFVGLLKLWVSNRHMRRLEELDAERQTRMAQLKQSGVSASTSKYHRLGDGKDIPFGVKALENNVEVEGIWIARMASMASRPPERKWSSMRKVRAPSAASSHHHGSVGLNSTTRRSQRSGGGGGGSRRTAASSNKISRSETVVPSSHTKHKLEDLSLLEEEERDRDLEAGHHGHSHGHGHGQGGNKGTLGKIQRGLKKMTSTDAWTETWQTGDRKKQARAHNQRAANKLAGSGSGSGSSHFGAKEFREGAQARTPQRFYPPSTTTTTTTKTLVGGRRGSQESKRQGRPRNTLVKKNSRSSSQGSQSSVATAAAAAVRAPPSSTRASVEKSRSRERPAIPTRVSSESARTSVSREREREREREPKQYGAYRQPRSRRNSREQQQQQQQQQQDNNRRRNSDGSEQQQNGDLQRSTAGSITSHRYPPNSSRSGGAAYPPWARSFNN